MYVVVVDIVVVVVVVLVFIGKFDNVGLVVVVVGFIVVVDVVVVVVGASVGASVFAVSSSSRTGRKSPSFHREPPMTPKAGLSSIKPSDISPVDKLLSILSFKLSIQGSVQPDLSGSGESKSLKISSQNQKASCSISTKEPA